MGQMVKKVHFICILTLTHTHTNWEKKQVARIPLCSSKRCFSVPCWNDRQDDVNLDGELQNGVRCINTFLPKGRCLLTRSPLCWGALALIRGALDCALGVTGSHFRPPVYLDHANV